jgi:HSP20 family protein
MLYSLVPWRRSQPERAGAGDFVGDFDRVFDQLWRGFGLQGFETPRSIAPRTDVSETDSEYRIEAELPGLEEKDISVTLENGVLTLAGERKDERESEDEKRGIRHRESFRGSFRRSFGLPEDVDENAVAASYKNGVLYVSLPKLPTAKPEVRTIPVQTS